MKPPPHTKKNRINSVSLAAFNDSAFTNKRIEHPQLVRLWKTLHKKAGVRWRSPKQTRHTFISMMCMAGENVFGLAKMVGHKNAKMIFENYMRFIKDANKSHGHSFVNDWSKIS